MTGKDISRKSETKIATIIAAISAAALAAALYFAATRLMGMAGGKALPIAVFLGGVDYFALRYAFLASGRRRK
jgi:hypothetical protein